MPFLNIASERGRPASERAAAVTAGGGSGQGAVGPARIIGGALASQASSRRERAPAGLVWGRRACGASAPGLPPRRRSATQCLGPACSLIAMRGGAGAAPNGRRDACEGGPEAPPARKRAPPPPPIAPPDWLPCPQAARSPALLPALPPRPRAPCVPAPAPAAPRAHPAGSPQRAQRRRAPPGLPPFAPPLAAPPPLARSPRPRRAMVRKRKEWGIKYGCPIYGLAWPPGEFVYACGGGGHGIENKCGGGWAVGRCVAAVGAALAPDTTRRFTA